MIRDKDAKKCNGSKREKYFKKQVQFYRRKLEANGPEG